jgi:hypothetical protein
MQCKGLKTREIRDFIGKQEERVATQGADSPLLFL